MAEILDNQELTTDMLNNIAIDLGATSFNGFTTNKFGADALNDITKALVSKGITQGGNKCAPYLSGGDLYISTGTIIFESGAKIRVESAQKVTAQAGTYIYALNDTARNIAQIVVSDTAPTTGDYVELAYLDSAGSLTDRREWSQSNVLLASNQSLDISFSASYKEGAPVTEEITVDWDGWTKIIYDYKYKTSSGKYQTVKCIADVSENVSVALGRCTNYYTTVTVVRNGSKITFVISISGYTGNSGTFNFTLI